jgi:hypothetical protein
VFLDCFTTSFSFDALICLICIIFMLFAVVLLDGQRLFQWAPDFVPADSDNVATALPISSVWFLGWYAFVKYLLTLIGCLCHFTWFTPRVLFTLSAGLSVMCCRPCRNLWLFFRSHVYVCSATLYTFVCQRFAIHVRSKWPRSHCRHNCHCVSEAIRILTDPKPTYLIHI